jgi:AAA+ superfamily predicted ATPase
MAQISGCEICELQGKDWVKAQVALVEALGEDPDRRLLEDHLLGHRCHLLTPFADRPGLDLTAEGVQTYERLRQCVLPLLDVAVRRNFLSLYAREGSPDPLAQRRHQAESLLKGLVNAHQAAAAAQFRPPHFRAEFLACAGEGLRAFQIAYPTGTSVEISQVWAPPLPGAAGETLASLLDELVRSHPQQAVGFLVLRRVLLHLLLCKDHETLRGEVYAETPLLLHDPTEQGRGLVAHLRVRRCAEGLPLYYPDPLTLALVTLDAELLASLHRAWEQTALHRSAVRDRSLCIEIRGAPVPSLEGPSLGAALACAMRAAAAGEQLDPTRAVSAALPPRLGGGLRTVGGVEDKLIAAGRYRDAGGESLTEVILAEGQEWMRLKTPCVAVELAQDLDGVYNRLHAPNTPPVPPPPPPSSRTGPTPPQHLGPYRLVREMGHGPYRTLYEAQRADDPGQRVALAVPNDRHPHGMAPQFEAFSWLKASLQHPNLVAIREVQQHPDLGLSSVAYEFVEGVPLAQRLGEHPEPWPLDEVADLVGQVGAGLAAAHCEQIVHGELMPREVLLTREGNAKVLDVGRRQALHRAGLHPPTQAESSLYRPPELWLLHTPVASPEADVYALAAMACELLTGRQPLQPGLRDEAGGEAVASLPPVVPSSLSWPPSVPEPVRNVLGRELAGPPGERYATMEDFLRAWRQACSGATRIGLFLPDLELALEAGAPLLYVQAGDESAILERLQAIADRLGRNFYTWRLTTGVTRRPPAGGRPICPGDPYAALQWLAALDRPALVVFLGFDAYFVEMPVLLDPEEPFRASSVAHSQNPPSNHGLRPWDRTDTRTFGAVYDDRNDSHRVAVAYPKECLCRGLRELAGMLRNRTPARTAVVLAPATFIPPELTKEFQLFLPAPTGLQQVHRRLREDCAEEEAEPEWLNAVVRDYHWHAGGLGESEIDDSLRLSRARHGKLTPACLDDLRKDKERIVRRQDLLELCYPDTTLNDVVGLRWLRDWLEALAPARQAALAGGFWPVKGVLLGGMPDCGKSHCAQAIAGSWSWPLLRLDVGRVFGRLLGQSEQNMRAALSLAEEMSPVVLWVDEIDKGLRDAAGTPSGTTLRVTQTFLTWLQERNRCVFLVATAKDEEGLLPELLRAGRFDGAFFLDWPTREERIGLLRHSLGRHRRSLAGHDLNTLADRTAGFSGAELTGRVVNALFRAARAGRCDPTPEELEAALKETPLPLARRPEQAKRLERLRTTWLSFALPASPPDGWSTHSPWGI